jgi:predicted DCC family thiol-disulfide oxidoreductase YuxK
MAPARCAMRREVGLLDGMPIWQTTRINIQKNVVGAAGRTPRPRVSRTGHSFRRLCHAKNSSTSHSTLQAQNYGDRFFTPEDERPIILFDGVCNLYVFGGTAFFVSTGFCILVCSHKQWSQSSLCRRCNGAVNFMLDWDVQGKCRFAALQSDAGQELLQRAGRSRDDISSMVLVEKDNSYIKSDAVLRTAQYLDAPILPLLASVGLLVAPKPLRDFLYDGVAGSRYDLFGRSSTCRLDDPRFRDRFVSIN